MDLLLWLLAIVALTAWWMMRTAEDADESVTTIDEFGEGSE